MNVKEFVENNLENMKNDLGVLVSHNSVLASDEKPFGKETRACLDDALKLMEREGLKTKNLDYYCGYGEIGEGEKLIGILAHLDVVPAGEGWDSDPFKMVEKDGYLYGRGVTDDKGAVVASLYALKYLKETNYPFKKRVRLITGCNEETGSACIAYYVSKEGHIDLGFTPDGNFPGIYAEKGMVSARLIGHHTKFKDIKGGDASNVVCKKVTCRIENDLDINVFKAYLDDKAINYEIECEDNDLVITVFGKAAHASMPDQGVNAIMYLFEALYVAGFNDSFVNHIHKYFALTNHGELLKLEEIKDDVTDTSINLGVISKKDDDAILTFDMRFPVKTNSETVLSYLKVLNDGDNEFVVNGSHNPLYFDIESPMIKALHKAYVDVTGDREHQMEAIGGGTYAKAINNCIAFGCEFPGEDCHIHDANECLSIENFKRQVLIYVEAIKNLNEV